MTASLLERGAATTAAPHIAETQPTAFVAHRQAALALLNEIPNLSHNEGGFLGHVVVTPALTDKQRDWLVKILVRNDMPPLVWEARHG
jgi:hypothetical protein